MAAGGQETGSGDVPPSSNPAPAVSVAEDEKVCRFLCHKDPIHTISDVVCNVCTIWRCQLHLQRSFPQGRIMGKIVGTDFDG